MHTCDVIQKQHLYTFVPKCACVLRVCNVQIRSNKSRLFCHIVDTLINAFLIHSEWAARLEQELVGFGNRLRSANQFFAAKKQCHLQLGNMGGMPQRWSKTVRSIKVAKSAKSEVSKGSRPRFCPQFSGKLWPLLQFFLKHRKLMK